MATSDQYNISLPEQSSNNGPGVHVIMIVGFIVAILLVVAAIFLFRYISRVKFSWRERRSEEAMARAIDIYNSQEPLEEPHLAYIRPGEQSDPRPSKNHRGEIAFVHSDGRIDRFRPLIDKDSRRKSLTLTKQHCFLDTRSHSHGANTACNSEEYTCFQPLCVKMDSVHTTYFGADVRDTISLEGGDIPPSYEEAINLPKAVSVDSASRSMANADYYNVATGRRLEFDYCNIDITTQNRHADSTKVYDSD